MDCVDVLNNLGGAITCKLANKGNQADGTPVTIEFEAFTALAAGTTYQIRIGNIKNPAVATDEAHTEFKFETQNNGI